MGHCASKPGGGPGPPLASAGQTSQEEQAGSSDIPTALRALTAQNIFQSLKDADSPARTRALLGLGGTGGQVLEAADVPAFSLVAVSEAALRVLGLTSAAAYSRFMHSIIAMDENLQAVLRQAVEDSSDRQPQGTPVAIVVRAPTPSSGVGAHPLGSSPFLGLVLTPSTWRETPDSEECLPAVLVEHLPAWLPPALGPPTVTDRPAQAPCKPLDVGPFQATQTQHDAAEPQQFEFVSAVANATPHAVAVCTTDGHQVLFQNAASLRYGGDLRAQGQQFDYLQQLLRLHTPDLLNQLLEAVIVQEEPWTRVVQVPPSLMTGSKSDSLLSTSASGGSVQHASARPAVSHAVRAAAAAAASSPAVSASIANLFLSAVTTATGAMDEHFGLYSSLGIAFEDADPQHHAAYTPPQRSAAPSHAGKGGDVSVVGPPQQAATQTRASLLGCGGDARASKHIQSVGLQHEEAGPTAAAQGATAGWDDVTTLAAYYLLPAATATLPLQPRLDNLTNKSISWKDLTSTSAPAVPTTRDNPRDELEALRQCVDTSADVVGKRSFGRVSPNSAFMMPSSSSDEWRFSSRPWTSTRSSFQPLLQPVYSADAAPARAAMMSRARTDLLASADTIHASEDAASATPRVRHRKAMRRSSSAHVRKGGVLDSADFSTVEFKWRASIRESQGAPSPTRARLFSLLNQRDSKASAFEAASLPLSSHGRLQTTVYGAPEPTSRSGAGAARPADTAAAGTTDTCWPSPQPVVAKAVDPPGTAETSFTGAAAEPCWHEVSVVPFTDPDTKNKVLLVCHNDVTARVQMEQRLMQLTEAQLYMLENMFPRHILERLARIASSDAVQPSSMLSLIKELSHVHTHHDCVTIMFTDIVGFTSMSKECEPQQVMAFLNQLFSKFDELVKKHKVSKVETAGDCYIVAAGLLDEDADGFHALAVEGSDEGQATSRTRSARRVLNFATEMMHVARTVMMPHNGQPVVQRVGVHSGPIVSGLIGQLLPKFALFGDTMNTASRMESTSIPGRIQVSEFTYNLLRDDSDSWECTGGVEVKGLGVMSTYLLSEAALQRTAPRHPPDRAAAAAAGAGYDSTRSSRAQHIPAYFQSSNASSRAQQLSQSEVSTESSNQQFAWAPGELAHCLLAAMDSNSLPEQQQRVLLTSLSLHNSQPRVQERLSRTMPSDRRHDVALGLATTQPQGRPKLRHTVLAEGPKLATRASVPVAASYRRAGEEERDRDMDAEEGGGVAVGVIRHASQPHSSMHAAPPALDALAGDSTWHEGRGVATRRQGA